MAMAMAMAMATRRCIFVVVLAMVAISATATAEASYGRTITVGGDAHWDFGFNYTDWAINSGGPFHVGDTLAFFYKPTQFGNITIEHNVKLLRSQKALNACNFKRSVLLAEPSQGPSGFKFKLTQRKPYHFACSERDGFHCSVGQMRFSVNPK